MTEVLVLKNEWLVGVPLTSTSQLKQTITIINLHHRDYLDLERTLIVSMSGATPSLSGCWTVAVTRFFANSPRASRTRSTGRKEEDKFESESKLQNLIVEQNPSSPKLQPFFLSRLPLELRSLV